MADLVICLLQNDLAWEDREKNLSAFGRMIDDLEIPVDLILLPELFNTGFSLNPERCAEPMDGPAMEFLRMKAAEKNCMITGSIQVREEGRYYNRLISMQPDGTFMQYDKRHLFALSDEKKFLERGSRKMVVHWKGWNILPLVCYDLRFPVWSRNRYANNSYEYDLLVYVANWPESRTHVWKTLLATRAIENMAYAAGVNRTGTDYQGTSHGGGSVVMNPKGFVMADAGNEKQKTLVVSLPESGLRTFREENPFAGDWDQFNLL